MLLIHADLSSWNAAAQRDDIILRISLSRAKLGIKLEKFSPLHSLANKEEEIFKFQAMTLPVFEWLN